MLCVKQWSFAFEYRACQAQRRGDIARRQTNMDPSATAHEEGEQPVAAHSTERQQGSGELSKLQELRLNLNECNWEQLEERYADAMNEHSTVEESLQAEMAELLEVSCSGI